MELSSTGNFAVNIPRKCCVKEPMILELAVFVAHHRQLELVHEPDAIDRYLPQL